MLLLADLRLLYSLETPYALVPHHPAFVVLGKDGRLTRKGEGSE